MEFNFELLVVAALAGLIAKMILGWNPQAVLGALSLVLLWLWVTVQTLPLVFERDPIIVQATVDAISARLVSELASMFVGELAGVYAAAILQTVRGWLRGW